MRLKECKEGAAMETHPCASLKRRGCFIRRYMQRKRLMTGGISFPLSS